MKYELPPIYQLCFIFGVLFLSPVCMNIYLIFIQHLFVDVFQKKFQSEKVFYLQY